MCKATASSGGEIFYGTSSNPDYSTSDPLLLMCLGSNRREVKYLGPCTHVEEASGSWLFIGLAWSLQSFGAVNQN